MVDETPNANGTNDIQRAVVPLSPSVTGLISLPVSVAPAEPPGEGRSWRTGTNPAATRTRAPRSASSSSMPTPPCRSPPWATDPPAPEPPDEHPAAPGGRTWSERGLFGTGADESGFVGEHHHLDAVP